MKRVNGGEGGWGLRGVKRVSGVEGYVVKVDGV